MLSRQFTHEGTFAHGWEPNEADTSNTCSRDIEARASAAAAASGGSELTEMEGRGFVLLCPSHLFITAFVSDHRGHGKVGVGAKFPVACTHLGLNLLDLQSRGQYSSSYLGVLGT
jgi:hypothetical protein